MNLPFPLTEQAIIVRGRMAEARRTRSAERIPDDVAELSRQNTIMFDRLTHVMERLADSQEENRRLARERPIARVEPFKPPHYNGTGSVEIFIRQFEEVSRANQWTAGAELLHLRGALEDEARDCGGAEDTAEVIAALRNRFGLTYREARSKLSQLKRDNKTSLHEHASRVEELVKIAYPDLEPELRMEMAVDHFSNGLNNSALQKHLLAVRPHALQEAVTAGNEYLQIKTGHSSSVNQVDVEVEEETEAKVISTQSDPISLLTETVQQLTKQNEMLQMLIRGRLARTSTKTKNSKKKTFACYNCGKQGHMQKDCRLPAKVEPTQGNGQGQQ